MRVRLQEDDRSEWLYAEFKGSQANAKMLASILRAWGTEAEARPGVNVWRMDLYAGQLARVENEEFKKALKAFIDKLREKALITEEYAERLKWKIDIGPNVVELAGVEFKVVKAYVHTTAAAD